MGTPTQPGTEAFVISAQSHPGSERFGIWDVVPEPQVSFSTEGMDLPERTLWRMDLPADQDMAAQSLSQVEAQLQASQNGLEAAADRFDQLTWVLRRGVSFDANELAAALSPADQETIALLRSLQTPDQGASFGVSSGEFPFDFSSSQEATGKWSQISREFQGFVTRIEKTISHYAFVETRRENELLVQTVVDWNGSFETTWQNPPDAQLVSLHERTLKLTLESRTSMLRTVIVVSAGALKLASLLLVPGGGILALPAAFHYIKQVQAEIARLQ